MSESLEHITWDLYLSLLLIQDPCSVENGSTELNHTPKQQEVLT